MRWSWQSLDQNGRSGKSLPVDWGKNLCRLWIKKLNIFLLAAYPPPCPSVILGVEIVSEPFTTFNICPVTALQSIAAEEKYWHRWLTAPSHLRHRGLASSESPTSTLVVVYNTVGEPVWPRHGLTASRGLERPPIYIVWYSIVWYSIVYS